jgi:hypothetical protein
MDQRGMMSVTANAVPDLLILVTLKMEEICSSETSVSTRATRSHAHDTAFLQEE